MSAPTPPWRNHPSKSMPVPKRAVFTGSSMLATIHAVPKKAAPPTRMNVTVSVEEMAAVVRCKSVAAPTPEVDDYLARQAAERLVLQQEMDDMLNGSGDFFASEEQKLIDAELDAFVEQCAAENRKHREEAVVAAASLREKNARAVEVNQLLAEIEGGAPIQPFSIDMGVDIDLPSASAQDEAPPQTEVGDSSVDEDIELTPESSELAVADIDAEWAAIMEPEQLDDVEMGDC
jgi:hypothetical protein